MIDLKLHIKNQLSNTDNPNIKIFSSRTHQISIYYKTFSNLQIAFLYLNKHLKKEKTYSHLLTQLEIKDIIILLP